MNNTVYISIHIMAATPFLAAEMRPPAWTVFENMLSRYKISTKDDYTTALHDVMKQTADDLYCGTLSRRDNTLLTVGFSLRTKQEQTLKVPQGRHLTL
jgi:hypothetical protein